MLSNRAVLLSIIFGVSLAGCSGGSAKESADEDSCTGNQITVWGEAPLFTSVSAARDKAQDDACRTAVSKCIGDEIASISGVADGQSITSEIFTQAKGICRNGQLIEENQYMLDTIKMHRVYMRYNVQRSVINEQIDTLQKQVGNPRILVLIREEHNLDGQKKRSESFTSRNVVAASLVRDFLTSKGYTVIDPRAVARDVGNEQQLLEDPEKLGDQLKEKAVQAGADVLIIGSLSTNPQKLDMIQGTGIKSYNATGNIMILTLWGRGKVLGEYNKSASGANIAENTASDTAIKRFTVGSEKDWEKKPSGLVTYLHRRLSDEWAEVTRNNVIELRVRGLDRMSAGIFRDDLIERMAVKTVNEISFDNNEGLWEVTYPGRSFALADTISFYKDDPRIFMAIKETGKKIEVERVDRGTIELRFR